MKKIFSILVLGLLLASNIDAAVAHVQTVNATDNDGGTTATGPSVNITTAGNHLILVVSGFDAGAGNPTASACSFNSVGGTQAITRQQAGGDSRLYIYYWENVADVTAAPTCTVSANAGWNLFAMEVSGVATSSSLDGAGSSATGTSISAAPTNFTASVSDGFWINAFNAEIATGTITRSDTNWTIPTTTGTLQNASNGSEGGVMYWANPGSAGAFNAVFTITSAPWASAQVVFKAAGGGGGGVQNKGLLLGVGQQ